MAEPDRSNRKPGYVRLWWHSYRVGFRWLIRSAPRLWPGRKAGLQRLLVPLDPWRYYEMGKLADLRYDGKWLDVSGPKLLTSLLNREQNGTWIGADLFEAELRSWKAIDPSLNLEVVDATAMQFDDASFDGVLSVSVLEHIGPGKDLEALKEMRRVVRPGGTLQLTTMVGSVAHDVFVDHEIYGEASQLGDERGVFFEHVYDPIELNQLVADAGWEIADSEYAVHTKPAIQRRFYKFAPFSYVFGGLLRFWFPRTISVRPDDREIRSLSDDDAGVAYLKLLAV